MISISSLVIIAWRVRLYLSVCLLDHVARVAGRVVHGAHARALLRGGVFEQCAEDLRRDVARQELGEDFILLGLEFVDRAGQLAFFVSGNSAGMICCAVGICEITDLKRE